MGTLLNLEQPFMLGLAQRDLIMSILDEAAHLMVAALRTDGWPSRTAVNVELLTD